MVTKAALFFLVHTIGIEMASIGIDLGTTNCCVAYVDDGRVTVLQNEQGSRITPSYICFKSNGEKLFGTAAMNVQERNIKSTFHDIKRIIGRKTSHDGVTECMHKVQYRIASQEEKPVLGVNDEFITPEKMSGMLLAHLKKISEKRLNKGIENAVITVPTHFNNAQRKATMEAGRIAGFSKVQLLNEPTAAAIEYGVSNKIGDGRVILVYDFGGGTFDVSIIRYNEDRFEVLAVDGDVNLGGGDIDNKLFEFVSRKYNIKFDNHKGKNNIARLLSKCRQIKVNLSEDSTVDYDLYGFGLTTEEASLDRAEFEGIIQPILDKTMKCVDNCLQQDKAKNVKIDDVILVGGSSRILKIKSMLKKKLGKEAKENISPDESVAAGAAIFAAKLYDKQFQDLHLKDLCPYALGVMTSNGKMSVIIPKYSSLPATNSKLYQTVEDDQTTIQIKIYSGDAVYAELNSYLGLLEISGIALGPKGRIVTETFHVDTNGILSITAADDCGQSKRLTINMDIGY